MKFSELACNLTLDLKIINSEHLKLQPTPNFVAIQYLLYYMYIHTYMRVHT